MRVDNNRMITSADLGSSTDKADSSLLEAFTSELAVESAKNSEADRASSSDADITDLMAKLSDILQPLIEAMQTLLAAVQKGLENAPAQHAADNMAAASNGPAAGGGGAGGHAAPAHGAHEAGGAGVHHATGGGNSGGIPDVKRTDAPGDVTGADLNKRHEYRPEYIRLSDYGNDADALQRAIDDASSGDTIYIDEGMRVSIDEVININKDNITILGGGGSELAVQGSLTDMLGKGSGSNTNHGEIASSYSWDGAVFNLNGNHNAMDNLAITFGNKNGYGGHFNEEGNNAIKIKGDNARIEDVLLHNVDSGIFAKGDNTRMQDITFTSDRASHHDRGRDINGHHAIYISNAKDNVASNIMFDSGVNFEHELSIGRNAINAVYQGVVGDHIELDTHANDPSWKMSGAYLDIFTRDASGLYEHNYRGNTGRDQHPDVTYRNINEIG